MNLKDKAASLPASPGVYLMKNSYNSIIYVGKSKELKKRVQSYFRPSKTHSPKIEKLVKNIADFDFILTDTEFEAFMLECQFIKELKPLFNRMMKNPQSYVYIAISTDGKRNIEITSNPDKMDDNLYLGPFINMYTVERALQGIKDSFKINCSNLAKKQSPCLNYSIGLCNGRCFSGKAMEEYHSILNKLIALLSGTDIHLLEEMEQRMYLASEKLDFDGAAKYRDYLNAIHSLIKKEKVIEFIEENKNIIVLEYLEDDSLKFFLIKRNNILFKKKLQQDEIDINKITAIISSHFQDDSFKLSKSLNRDEIDEAQIVYSYLKSSSCDYLIVPDQWLDADNTADLKTALKELFDVESIKNETHRHGRDDGLTC